MKQNRSRVSALRFLLLLPGTLMASGGEHGIDMTHLIAQFVNFFVFFGGLAYILRKPVAEFFAKRVEDIRKSLEKAETSQRNARNELDRIEEKMKSLDAEVEEINAQARKQADGQKEAILAQARTDAARIVEQATADIDNMRREAVRELKAYITDMALVEAEKSIRQTVTGDERKQLFADFTAQMGVK